MPTVKVKHRETLPDVAVLQAGSISGMFELALLNNVSITEDMASGRELNTGAVVNQDILNDLRSRNAKPCHALVNTPGQNLEGIGYWRIGVDFIVQ